MDASASLSNSSNAAGKQATGPMNFGPIQLGAGGSVGGSSSNTLVYVAIGVAVLALFLIWRKK